MAAVLARKKQGDEEKARKLQQIKEDRIMAEELHRQRLEREVYTHMYTLTFIMSLVEGFRLHFAFTQMYIFNVWRSLLKH